MARPARPGMPIPGDAPTYAVWIQCGGMSTADEARASVSRSTLQVELEKMGIAGFSGHLPTLFPHKLKPEEHLTSRLIAALVAVRPFRMRFFEHTRTLGGRRPSTARERSAQVRALALLEPRLDASSQRRADAIISIRNGTRRPWRCVLEVKYLSEGRNGPGKKQTLSAQQLATTYFAARNARLEHVLTVSHETEVNGLSPSGFTPPSGSTGPTMSHLSWLSIAALIQRTLDEDSELLDHAARTILSDFGGYLRSSQIWTYATNVSLSRTDFSAVRNACRSGASERYESPEVLESFHEVVLRWQQFGRAAADGITARTGVGLQPNTQRLQPMVKRLQATGRLQMTLRAAQSEIGDITATVDLRARTLETAWVIDVAARSASVRPRTATRWAIVEELLHGAPKGTRRVEVLDAGGEIIAARRSVSLLRNTMTRNPVLLKAAPHTVRFVRTQSLKGREDFKSNNVTPALNDMLMRSVSW